MITEKNLALAANRLQVPMIVSDILDEGKSKKGLTDEVQFGLHEILSEMQPDAALLAIAFSAKRIADIYRQASPSMKVMDMEAARIITSYTDLWVRNAKNEKIDEQEIIDALSYVAEDLEGLAELLDLNVHFLRAKDGTASKLCDLLSIQAKAHNLIAEEFEGALQHLNADIAIDAIAPQLAEKALENAKVIPFPRRAG